jgi:phage-related protein
MAKPIRWLHGEIKTPPMGENARRAVGFLLRELQEEEVLSMPESRPMPTIGPACHELRIPDQGRIWRVMYHLPGDAVVVLDVFEKKTAQTPQRVLDNCRKRLRAYRETFP